MFFSEESNRLIYDVTNTVTANDGATINKVEYLDGEGNLIEIYNIYSPSAINLQIRTGLAIDAAIFGDIPFGGSLTLNGKWTPKGGLSISEEQSIKNDTPNSTINNGELKIPERTLPD